MTSEIDRLIKKIRNDDSVISQSTTLGDKKCSELDITTNDKQKNNSDLNNISNKNIVISQHLKNLLKLNESTKKISSISMTDEFVIAETIYAIVSAKHKYRDTFTLILEDNTGQITGHTNLDTFSVGDILELENCGLWKTASGNELNITSRNLIHVYTKTV